MVHFAYSFLQYDEEIVLFIFPVTAGDIMLSWNGCVSPQKKTFHFVAYTSVFITILSIESWNNSRRISAVQYCLRNDSLRLLISTAETQS